MNRLKKPLCLAVAAALLLLCACGIRSKSGVSAVSRAFAAQDGYLCTLEYDAELSASIFGQEYRSFTQHFSVQGPADPAGETCSFSGTLQSSLGHNSGDYELPMSVSAADGASLYQFGTQTYTGTQENPYAALASLPARFADTADRFTMTDSSVLLNNEHDISIYKGEIPFQAHQSPTFTAFGALLDPDLSLGKCDTSVELWVYNDSGLPADLTLSYHMQDESAPIATFTDAEGNTYTVNSFRLHVSYDSYDAQDISLPGADLSAAATAADFQTFDFSATFDASRLNDSIYSIYNGTGSYSFELLQPQYMSLVSHERQSALFRYYYSDTDYETYRFAVCDGYPDADAAAFASSLPALYEAGNGYSDISAEEIRSGEFSGFPVRYRVLHMTYTQDGTVYQMVEIYAWTPAGADGTDSLEVDILEYNASGVGIMVDPVTELTAAFESILGTSQHEVAPIVPVPDVPDTNLEEDLPPEE